jgi:multiple sugar transport system substrate-binding protein
MSAADRNIVLRGLCWDHPRCTTPMAAAAAEWARRRPDVRIQWDARPLAAFNDQPVAAAVAGYDLMFVDHPMMGETAATGCLAPLDELIAPQVLAALAADSIAGSHDTYAYAGRQWALAVDAACQVAVASEPGLDRLGGVAPGTWAEVLDLARAHPAAVAIPLYPSDAFCALLSLSADGHPVAGGPAGHPARDGSGPAAGRAGSVVDATPGVPFTEDAVEALAELAAVADPRSYDLNPPALLDLMSGADPGEAPAYAPLVFGYSGYQRRGRLRFHDVPTSGGVLGGAGIAVTAGGRRPSEAAAFAAWIAGTAAQRDIVCPHEGQPASATVWADPSADRLVGGFFSATRATIDHAVIRPREPWWPRFQEEAGVLLARTLRERVPARKVHAELTAVLDRHRTEEDAR